MDGTDSTEVWGTFRAGRRARVGEVATSAAAGVLTIEAVHDGFRRLPGRPWHRRRWSLTEAGLQVTDCVTGRGRHSVVVRWHLAPESALRLISGGAVVTTPAGEFQITVSSARPVALVAEQAPIATGFGRTVRAPVLACHVESALPVQIRTQWYRCENGQPAGTAPARAAAAPGAVTLSTAGTRAATATEPAAVNEGAV